MSLNTQRESNYGIFVLLFVPCHAMHNKNNPFTIISPEKVSCMKNSIPLDTAIYI